MCAMVKVVAFFFGINETSHLKNDGIQKFQWGPYYKPRSGIGLMS